MPRLLISILGILIFFTVLFYSTPAHAANPARDIAYVTRGTGKSINGAFALPTRIIQGAASSFPFGIVTGAIRGTFETVGWVVSGAADLATGAAPYAKYAAFI